MSGKNKNNKNRSKTYTPKGQVKTAHSSKVKSTGEVKNLQKDNDISSSKTSKQNQEEQKVETAANNKETNIAENKKETHKVDNQNSGSSTSAPSEEKQKQSKGQTVSDSKAGKVREGQGMSIKMRNGLTALGLIGSTIIVGIVATLLGGPLDDSFKKPPVYPPEWLFPVVWTILYISIGIAAYVAFCSASDSKKRKWDLIWYGIHLFFNFMWPLFYFTLSWLIFSCIWLVFVVITAIIVTYRYYRANLASGIIFTCYTLWLLYALYLSMGITILNVM